jgi:hypothetical protein
MHRVVLRRFASFFAPIGGGSDTPKVMQDRQLCCSLVEFFTSFLRRFYVILRSSTAALALGTKAPPYADQSGALPHAASEF